MNYINFILIFFQIWYIYKYLKKLQDTDERLKDNEIDYSNIKLQLTRQECFINELQKEIDKLKQNLHN